MAARGAWLASLPKPRGPRELLGLIPAGRLPDRRGDLASGGIRERCAEKPAPRGAGCPTPDVPAARWEREDQEVGTGMFGKKDSIKEFEQMRQALKPAERFAVRSEPEANGTETGGASPAGLASQAAAAAASQSGATARSPAPATGEPMTVLSSGSIWQGSLKIEGSVRVEGQLSGEIEARDTVYVAEGSQVDAKINAALVVLAGEFQGEVNCRERLEIMPTGRVRARLTTKSLVVHEGAFMEGEIHMTEPRPTASPASDGGRPSTASRPAEREIKPVSPTPL
jgi:cytoskeletal protein CcmA (bactofilin family)